MVTRTIIFSLLTLAFATAAPGIARADEATDPIVVELFTSQGCSSCPPADKYLGALAQRPDVLALSFHVDYWDYIGWKDPFASHLATLRQRKYARTFDTAYVYTPQMVVNGVMQGVGSDRGTIEAAITHVKAEHRQHPSLILERQSDGGITIHVGAGSAKAQATVWLVYYDRKQVTDVPRGENAGSTLTDHDVVRRFEAVGSWKGEALDIPVAASILDDFATNRDRGLAAFVQTDGVGPILAAKVMESPR